MTAFAPIALGQPIPNLPHAVSCSLPTMRAVRGYEEKDPEIVGQLSNGYPRFVVHPFSRQLTAHFQQRYNLAGRVLWLASSPRMARNLQAFLLRQYGDSAPLLFSDGGIHGLSHLEDPETTAAAKTYLQNVGGFLSSRAAEDQLAQMGLIEGVAAEPHHCGDARAEILHQLRPLFSNAGDGDFHLATCGMSAVHAAFEAIDALQAPRGRTIWVQLGWLYLDTISILKRFVRSEADYVNLAQVDNLTAIENLFSQHGDRIAGLVIEAPTNPLIQTPDLAAIAAIARKAGARLLIDPSVSSAHEVDVFPYADVVALSLTKYTGSAGDIMGGLAVVNPTSPDATALRSGIIHRLDPPYPRDLARLAFLVGQTPELLRQIRANTIQVATWLESRADIKTVYWSHQPASRKNYDQIARQPDAVGGLISFVLDGDLEAFYDRLRLPKGPSFGMATTLICPFMYLAHYDLVSTAEGRAELAQHGLDPNLLRLAVGCEPAEEIIAALNEALV